MIKGSCKSVMEIQHDFSGCRFSDGYFEFNNWTITLEMASRIISDPESDVNVDLLLATAFSKLNFFLHSILCDVFVFPIKDSNLANDLVSTDVENVIMLLPETATDDIMCQALHSKIMTIVGDVLVVGELSLFCKQKNTKFYYYTMDGSYELPTQAEFIGEKSLHDTPWWTRYDCDTLDLECPDDMDEEEKKQTIANMCTSQILDDIEQMIKDERGLGQKKKQIIDMDEIRVKWSPREV